MTEKARDSVLSGIVLKCIVLSQMGIQLMMMMMMAMAIVTGRTTVEPHAVASGGMLIIQRYLRNERLKQIWVLTPLLLFFAPNPLA